MPDTVTIVGSGLAGSEAAWQLAKRGIPVRLVEMKPVKITSDPSLSTARTSKSVPIMSSIDGQSLDI